MKIQNIKLKIKGKNAILSGEILLNSGKSHSVFFETDKKYKNYITVNATPFLAVALPIAMLKNEKIFVNDGVSEELITKTPEIMSILSEWNLELKPIVIEAQSLDAENVKLTNINGRGCFFSGGADSLYTYIKNNKSIDSLIFVHGFDINVKNIKLFNTVQENIKKISEEEDKNLIIVKTNIREIYDEYFDWIIAHEFAVSSVALLLSKGFCEIFVSCGIQSTDSPHKSMTPELDPLWSSKKMKIHHFGCDAGKIDKLLYISNFRVATENLRVCWVNKGLEYNCSHCEKCLRNMLALFVTNSLNKIKTFNHTIDLSRLKKLKIDSHTLTYFSCILDVLIKNNDQSEVRYALEELVSINKKPNLRRRVVNAVRDNVNYVDKKYNRNRMYWFLAQKGYL